MNHERFSVYFFGNDCPGLPDGTRVSQIIDGTEFPSIRFSDGANILDIAKEHIASWGEDIVTGSELAGAPQRARPRLVTVKI